MAVTCPFPRFIDFRRHGNLLRSSATLPSTPRCTTLHEVIHEVYARGRIERGPGSWRLCGARWTPCFRPVRSTPKGDSHRRGTGSQVDLHPSNYMDPHDFDLERCTALSPLPAGRRAHHAGLWLNLFPSRGGAAPDAGSNLGNQRTTGRAASAKLKVLR